MAICLYDISALWFWRHYNASPNEHVFARTGQSGPTAPQLFPVHELEHVRSLLDFSRKPDYATAQTILSAGYNNAFPLHVLVNRKLKTNATKSVITHTLMEEPPAGSLLRYNKNLCVASPELTLLSASTRLSFVELLMLAYEFCGCYSSRPDLEGGILTRPPLTSKQEIESFAKSLHGQTGAKQLRNILPYLADGSGSPRETAVAILFCLPKRLGGCGLPLPEMNIGFRLTGAASKLWGYGNAFDLVWKEAKAIIEYDGESYHSTDDQKDRDHRRRNALTSKGYAVFVLNKKRLSSIDDTLAVAEAIAERLHRRLRFREGFHEKHLKLRSQVLKQCRYPTTLSENYVANHQTCFQPNRA